MDQTGKDPIISAPSETPLWTKLALMTASIAAIGAVFGAFYLGTVFSNAPLETKSVATAETTGSASAQDNPRKEETQTTATASAPVEASNAANCREQTWPYIARPCLANEKGGRGVRVISTDKLADPVISVVETPPDAVINRKAAPAEPPKGQAAAPAPAAVPAPAAANNSASAEVTPLKSGAALGAVAISPAALPPAQTPEPVAAASPPPAEPPVQPAATPATPPQPAVQATAAVEPQAVPDKRSEKSKRKAAKRQDDRFKDSERSKTVTAQSDDDDEDAPVAEKSSGRIKGRVVERWTERDYNVPSHDGSGTRRVIVNSRDDTYRERSVSTERGGGLPNIFGAIFGN
jgi:hypothetical protein